jgi:hypothetical protein
MTETDISNLLSLVSTNHANLSLLEEMQFLDHTYGLFDPILETYRERVDSLAKEF